MIVSTRYMVVPTDGDVPHDQEVAFFGHVDDAVAHLGRLRAGAACYVIEPLSESAHWDWGVRPPARGTDPPGRERHVLSYVHEQAARACTGDGTLMRRRRGTKEWKEVPG